MKSLGLILLIAISGNALADTEDFVFDMAGESEPLLRVNVLHGGVVVRGHDGNVVRISADFEQKEAFETEVSETGMRTLPNLGKNLVVHQDGAEVIVRAGSEGQPVQLAIQVPRNTNLTLTVRQGGNIRVDGVSGEMQLQNSWGRIDLEDISNTVIAHAQSDDVTAQFVVMDLPGPSAFSSWSGDIQLDFPDDMNASLRWRSNYGRVLSEFDVHGIETKSTREETAGSARVEGYTIGSLNDGGPEVSAITYSGDVIFKRARAQ